MYKVAELLGLRWWSAVSSSIGKYFSQLKTATPLCPSCIYVYDRLYKMHQKACSADCSAPHRPSLYVSATARMAVAHVTISCMHACVMHALLTPILHDICEQTESIDQDQGHLRSQLQLGQNGGIWTAEHVYPFFLASAAVATALASLVASDMYKAAKVSTQVKSQTRSRQCMARLPWGNGCWRSNQNRELA